MSSKRWTGRITPLAHAEFFGDCYQYTHRVLLRAIAPPDQWIVHPMLFRRVGGGPPGGGLATAAYAQCSGLAGEAVLSEKRERRRLTRHTMVADVEPYLNHYLFLDPDTGIDIHGGGSTSHVAAQQLAEIAQARNGEIALVFDHAYAYEAGKAQDRVFRKLQFLWNAHQLHGAAVIVRTNPLVTYVWVSTEYRAVEEVRDRIRRQLPIPERWMVFCPH